MKDLLMKDLLLRITLPAALATVTVVGFISLLWLLAFHSIPVTSHDVLMASAGYLSAAFQSIIAYHFGSSSGSARKTEIMADKDKVKP